MRGLYPSEDLYPSDSLYPRDESGRIAVTQEFPPDRLAVRISTATGHPFRWAEDEPLAENVISGLTKSGEMPGGHKELGGTLARDPRIDYPDLETYSDVVLEQAGGELVWSGRLTEKPESDGERMAIEPKAIGHQAALEDRKAIQLGIINRDLSRWTGPSAQRRINNGVYNPNQNDPQAVFDSTAASLRLAVSDTWTSPVLPRCEAWFDAGSGIRVGRLLANWKGDPNLLFVLERYGCDDDVTTGYEGSEDIYTKEAWTDDFSPATPRRFLTYMWRYSATSAGVAGMEFALSLTYLTVIADHGLDLQGTWPDVGFTAKQILGYAIPRFTYLEVDEEELEDTGYVIPQAWYSEPGDMAAIVKDVTKYDLLDWFVLDGKRFELRVPGTYGRFWQAYAGPSELSETGEDGSRLWSEIVVRYQDVDGTTRTVGPPGSGADLQVEGLRIEDPDHPAVKAGLTREDLLDLNGTSVAAAAQAAGELWLREANQLSHAGTATLRGYAMDDKSVFRPVAQVQPGDWIRFPDAGSGGTGYRKIVQVSYEHDSRTATLNLDAPPEAIAALLERLQASLVPSGLA